MIVVYCHAAVAMLLFTIVIIIVVCKKQKSKQRRPLHAHYRNQEIKGKKLQCIQWTIMLKMMDQGRPEFCVVITRKLCMLELKFNLV